MPVPKDLISQALRTPETQFVQGSPIVRAILLADPANAAQLVPLLSLGSTLEARNARRVLCLFGPSAVPHLLSALAATPALAARTEGAEILFAMLASEAGPVVLDYLQQAAGPLTELLGDERPLPDIYDEHVEQDFKGRICDLYYVMVRELLDSDYDQSSFRRIDENERTAEIRQFSLGRVMPIS